LDDRQRADAEDPPGRGDGAEPKIPHSRGVTEDGGQPSADDTHAKAPRDQGITELVCQQQCGANTFARWPIEAYMHRLDMGAHEYMHQWVVAAVGLAMGGLCVWNGPKTWQALFTATVVGLATSIARNEAEAWGSDVVSELLLMFQTSLATGVAIQSGFNGFQVLFGTAVGFLVCYDGGGWATALDEHIPGFALLWYSLGAVLGALALTVWRQPLLVTLGPLTGGFLLSASAECLLASLVGAFSEPGAAAPGALPPPDMPWVDVAGELLFLAGPGAMAMHSGCAALATLVYKMGSPDERRLPAALCLVACVLVSSIVACVKGPPWLIGASVLWALSAALSSYHQLGMLLNWKARTLAQFVRQLSTGSYGLVPHECSLEGEGRSVPRGPIPGSTLRCACLPPGPTHKDPEDDPPAPGRADPEDELPAPGLQPADDPELGGCEGTGPQVVPKGDTCLPAAHGRRQGFQSPGAPGESQPVPEPQPREQNASGLPPSHWRQPEVQVLKDPGGGHGRIAEESLYARLALAECDVVLRRLNQVDDARTAAGPKRHKDGAAVSRL